MTITMAPCQEVIRLKSMADLRNIFKTPDDVNDMNFVLFSTSGIHGSYITIEEIERVLTEGKTAKTRDYFDDDMPKKPETYQLTVLVVQPRCVTMLFGHIDVRLSDIPYLKELRQRSWLAAAQIGAPRRE